MLCLWNSIELYALYRVERERERESSRPDALSTMNCDTGKERIYYRFHILYSSHYYAYNINVDGIFVLYFLSTLASDS